VASAAIPVSISATAALWRSEQHTAADRVRAHGVRSLTDELTIERQAGAWPLVASAAIPVSNTNAVRNTVRPPASILVAGVRDC